MTSPNKFLCVGFLGASFALSGCVTRPPTIAHVHIGHAITGVHVTPAHKGYMPLSEQRADESLAAAIEASHAIDLEALKKAVGSAVGAADDPGNFGLKQSLTLAANHITFAATSADASDNLTQFAPVFRSNITAELERCDYIVLLGKDVQASRSFKEASVIVPEIVKAAQANVDGSDGMIQLNSQLMAMIGREKPAYRTVDEWYLFNLVRLPGGRWVFDRLGRGGNIDGYQ